MDAFDLIGIMSTVKILDLNHIDRLFEREELQRQGLYPPQAALHLLDRL